MSSIDYQTESTIDYQNTTNLRVWAYNWLQEWKIQNLRAPYQDEQVLYYCYYISEFSLAETGSLLGCSPGTVRNWMEQYGIDRRTRLEAISKDYPSLSKHPCGYTIISDGQNTQTVYLHQLVACLNYSQDESVAEVFESTTHVHHRLAIPLGMGVKLDIPGNLEVLSVSEHKKLHLSSEPVEVECILISEESQ